MPAERKFDRIAQKRRWEILYELRRSGWMSVEEVARKINITQEGAQEHLDYLCRRGQVVEQKKLYAATNHHQLVLEI